MTIVSALFQRRRLLILCAATVALHYVTIDWVDGRLGQQALRPAPVTPSLMTAQLRLTLQAHEASQAPPPEVQPLPDAGSPRKPAAHRLLPRRAAPDGSIPVTRLSAEADDGAADSAPGSAALAEVAALAQAGAVQAQSAAPAPALAGSDPVPVLAADLAPPQGMRRYKVNLPPSADIDMQVARVDADGTRWNGVAHMAWHTDGSRYALSVEAGVSMLITRINLLVLSSAGSIDDFGIAPERATEKRARRAETATHFNRDAGTITFSASERSYPLLVGAQDKATVPFQLGGIGRADLKQFGGDVDIQVGEDKEANIFRFQLVGEEELDTGMGKLATLHLSRPPRPGTYSSRLDVWLAPGLNWYPVQIRNTEASGALTTQTVTHITQPQPGK